jgi:hypothetical protein
VAVGVSLAQPGDQGNGIHEVTGSIPVSSTNSSNNLTRQPCEGPFVSCLCLVSTRGLETALRQQERLGCRTYRRAELWRRGGLAHQPSQTGPGRTGLSTILGRSPSDNGLAKRLQDHVYTGNLRSVSNAYEFRRPPVRNGNRCAAGAAFSLWEWSADRLPLLEWTPRRMRTVRSRSLAT